MFGILKSVLVFSLYVISVDGNLALINAFAELQTQLNHRIELLNERIDQIEQQVHLNKNENDGNKLVSQIDQTYVNGLVKAFNSEKTYIRKTLDLYQNGFDALRKETTERFEKEYGRFRKELADDNETYQKKMSDQVMRLSVTLEQYKSLLCDPSCELNGGTCVKLGQCGQCPTGRNGENCEHKVTCSLPTERFTKDNTKAIFLIGEMMSANMVKCRHGTPSPGTMTCRADGSWDGEITCKEPQIECSLDLQHGTIIYDNGDYIPKCDTGYKLNHTDPEKPCTCVNNKIECFAKASPECIANNCKLPYVFNGFSVYEKKKNDLFMSGGMKIKHGSSAYFNCSRGMEKHNEPFDRQFKCELGKFMPVDGLEFDYSNDSTPVPLCRKAMCKHNCDNGGVCIRDNECQCPVSTTGQWCETVLCDPSCERNGGKCVKPGQCGKCPAGRYGENCENEITCTLPTDLTMDNHRTIFRSGEPISAHMVICRYGTPSPGTMTCRADGSWDGEITCIRNEIKYSVRLHVSANTYANKHSAGTADNVFLRFVGQNVQTDTFQLKGDFGGNKLVEMEYRGTDVRPIHYVIVSKDMGILIDNNLSLVFVSIYIEDSDEYYVFTGRSLHTWLTASQPLTLTVSDHPENCASHTYGGAFYRHPKQRGMSVGFLTLLECKKWCVTSRSISCKSVYYIPSSRLGKGHCYHYEHSPDDDKYFRDNNRRETNVSYERICKATEID